MGALGGLDAGRVPGMKTPLSLNAQARALRSLTGLPLAHCRRIMVMANAEKHRNFVMRQRSARATGRAARVEQLGFSDVRASDEEVARTFAEIRRNLEEVRP